MRAVVAGWITALLLVAGTALLPLRAVHAQEANTDVFYHDQSGTALSGTTASQAALLASQRLGFSVRLAQSWPAGTRLRGLWVMEQRAPRFAVLYYGRGDGYIACQLHESLTATRVVLRWVSGTAIIIGGTSGTLLQADIGGANPVSELVWRTHGVRYDLLGGTDVPLGQLLGMAASVTGR